MKIKYTTVITTMLLAVVQLSAQHQEDIKNRDVEGIYINIDDFKKARLTIPIDNKHRDDKIKLKQFFISPKIEVVEQGVESVFYKDSIFAIRLNNGQKYRFVNHTPCLIADTSYLYIYTNISVRTEYKTCGPRHRAKEIPITCYYFSWGNHETVYTLTLQNFRKYIVSNNATYEKIYNKFFTDDMLFEIDKNTGRFEVNKAILSLID